MTRHIAFPYFLGESNSSLIEYKSEKLPPTLTQGPKIAIGLKPPAKDHWNIKSDLIFPWILEDSWEQRAATRAAQSQEVRLKGSTASQVEAPTSGGSPELQARSSGKAPPTKTAPNREWVLGITCEILAHIHALHLQTMHKMGSMREVDRTLAGTLMAEFARLQLIVGEDFTKSLIALHTDLEASCETLVSDIARTMNLHFNDPASRQVKAALQKFQQATSLKVNLPLMELEAAHKDMEEFMWSHLQEINSQTESRELMGELTEVSQSLQQGMRTCPGSRAHRGRGVPTSLNTASSPSTSQG